jgi:hypothetical protein
MNHLQMKFFSWHLDFVGFWASLLCAIHCALMPVVLTLSAYAGASWLANPMLEWSFIGISMAVAAWSLLQSYTKQHQNALPLLLAGLGLLLLLGSQNREAAIVPWCMAVGGTLIAGAHYWNWRFSHSKTKNELQGIRLPKPAKGVLALLLLLYFLGLKKACDHNNTPPSREALLQVVWRTQQ